MSIDSSISPANFLGFLSLLAYILTLLPSSLRIGFPVFKKAKFIANLLKYRRQLGILAFLVALVHVVLIVIKRNVDLFDLQTYSISVEGTASLIIFALLAFTSNDWSVKKLKKNWRRLHQLTYTAIFFLFWHIQEKMSGHWNLLTPVELICMTAIIALFLKRRWIEYQKQYYQQAKK
ncbi:ferric reductase-like transmembrane domain-containing protein [Anabaena sp. PCC 7108]|uniref:ferric reductase-like transmembrane domain-containing protein n=1 Tax=Anabaena sp. PCC 7108 TaxID=163908 RepID=UPI000345E626|nr:ferric reductase-like transmembrane domain-containing protein [Anabaena sp. PCC 7108]